MASPIRRAWVLHSGRMTSRERLGVFGGTFDPPHIGHFSSAVNALQALSLDEVLLVVSNSPWQKVGTRFVSPVEDRFAMVVAGAVGHAGLTPSRLEIDRGGESNTVETLLELQARRPQAELFLLLGRDAAAGLATWRRHEELPALAAFAILRRPGSGEVTLPWPARVHHVDVPGLDISSTELRRRIRAHERVDYLLPDGVARIVERRLLYRGES